MARASTGAGLFHRYVFGYVRPGKLPFYSMISVATGGRGGIRTHGTLAGTPVFKTGALNHSATLPSAFS